MILTLFWALRALRSTLWQVSLWQVKEYRLDRVRAHFELPSSRRSLAAPLQVWKWFLLSVAVGLPRGVTAQALAGALLVTYLAESLAFATELFHRSFRRPKVTAKAVVLLGGSMCVVGLLFFLATRAGFPRATTLLLLDRFTFALVGSLVLASWPLTTWQRTQAIARATRKRKEHSSLLVVGITGSHGKTSTKEFLAHLLAPSHRVLKTPAHVNTDIGIAQTILRDLQPEQEIFVCEMGAYRAGEITRSAMMVHPHIGILTAIREQHLALFGSVEALRHAKGELLRALPPDGIAIINGDDPQCVTLGRETPARTVVRYGLDSGHPVHGADVRAERDRLCFWLSAWGERAEICVPLLGKHHVASLLAATAAASAVGIPFDAIVKRLRSVTPLPRSMEPRRGARGAFIIDDSYSANPDGVAAALDYFGSLAAPARVVILAPLIELGEAAREAHRRVGDALARARPSRIILTSPDYAAEIRAGGGEAVSRALVVEGRPGRLHALVQPFLAPENVVLLEGRIPDRVRTELLRTTQ